MKTVGRRQQRPITDVPDADALRDAALHSEVVAKLSGWRGMPKGVFRYKTHAEANRHQEAYQIRFMVELARLRQKD